MSITKAFFALLVTAVTRQASSKVPNVTDDRGALRGVIFDERPLQGSDNRGANRNHITDTPQTNIRDDVEQANSEDSDYAGNAHEKPPMTTLVDGADVNTVDTTGRKLVTPSSTEKDGEASAKGIETGKHMNSRLQVDTPLRLLRFEIPVDTPYTLEDWFYAPTTLPPVTPLPAAQTPTVKSSHSPSTLITTSQPTRQPSAIPTFEIPVEDTPYTLEDWYYAPTTLPPVTPLPAAQTPTTKTSHSPSMLIPASPPTRQPSVIPATEIDIDRTETPTGSPSLSPTANPTEGPSIQPSGEPSYSVNPSAAPSSENSSSPSQSPSKQTTDMPTTSPSLHPTQQPTASPTELPSQSPSISATLKPSSQPSLKNSAEPSMNPSLTTYEPTSAPSFPPSNSPTNPPTPIVYCPPAYNRNKTNYGAGEKVEIYLSIYECAGGKTQAESYKYEPYCNIADQSLLGYKELELWNVAWAYVGPCYRTETPTGSPTLSPTENPTEGPSIHPSGEPSHSGHPSAPPSFEISSSPSQSPSKQTTDMPTTSPSLHPTQQSSTILPPTVYPTTVMPLEPTNLPTIDEEYKKLLTKFPYPYPYTRYTSWSILESEEKTVAGSLGYDRSSWDNLEMSDLESYSYVDLTADERLGVMSLGMDANMWDCYINHYSGYYWAHLEVLGVTLYLENLGYSQLIWDDQGYVNTEDMSWHELSLEQQDAAYRLCYFENSWDWISLTDW